MVANTSSDVYTGVLDEKDPVVEPEVISAVETKESEEKDFEVELVWSNITRSVFIHGCGIYALIATFTGQLYLRTVILGILYIGMTNLGIAGGAHRLWAHRAYKARLPLRILLLVFQTLAVQNSAYVWVRDHRVHHKFTETNADPHNIKRGFFFAHMGWLLCKKHPDVKTKGKLVDMSDLEKDPLIMWQHKHYVPMAYFSLYVFPTLVFKMVTFESWVTCFLICAVGRYSVSANLTWLINSYAHYYGNKPYDKYIQATDSIFMGIIGQGEGYHNYHHVFPWDYRASDMVFYRGFNSTRLMIDLFSLIGWAYDLKAVSHDMIRARVKRTGDGTHPVWGWGDKDIPKEHIQMTIRINKLKTK